MAAYAALCSLAHIIEQLQHHPTPPISLDKQQVQSLTGNVTFLQEFLEGYSIKAGGYSKEADPLEARIADAAHAAEDVIESHIVDRINASRDRKISFLNFVRSFWGTREANNHAAQLYQSLREVIEGMDSISKEVEDIKEKAGVRDRQHRNSSITSADSSRPSSTEQNAMVGFDEALLEILDKLAGGDCGRQVIPIVGMGGMGKTTLARNVYVNPLIQEHFDICAWATIAQEYNTQEILREILCPENKEELSDVEELGERLHKYLSGRRYLIVLDDMWSIEVWNEVRRFFPDYHDGSRIVITTRLLNLTSQLSCSYCFDMEFLDEDKSWNLLCKTVFDKEVCPVELEQIGKKIATSCKGLALSIVVTGGILVKSERSCEYWEYIAENLNSLVNSEDNERCLKILYMSYKEMPVHLKPCFLYLGIFPEDSVIRASILSKLWVAEGFLKPKSDQTLEENAEECLEELISRNLVGATRRVGKTKHCSMHDLLRDFCLREAQKERFYYVTKRHSSNDSRDINTRRHIIVPRKTYRMKVVYELESMSLARSLICEDIGVPFTKNFKLLRVLNAFAKYRPSLYESCLLEDMFHLVNSRYLSIQVNQRSKCPPSISLLWNLHTLKVDYPMVFVYPIKFIHAPTEIWMMPQLRHVKFTGGLYLPNPPGDDDIVLSNLQSLARIVNFMCREEVIKRIPNLKKLKIHLSKVDTSSLYFLSNLDRLDKLESFRYTSNPFQSAKAIDILLKLTFPHSLKKLTLKVFHVQCDKMMEKIGSLPFLEVLILARGSFQGCVWETIDGQFNSLKFLGISSIDLEYWKSESTHFPCLEQLVLKNLCGLKEIPLGIGEIPTLASIDLRHCSYSAAISARNILTEQENFGDVTLRVRVFHPYREEKEALESLASFNFQVQYP